VKDGSMLLYLSDFVCSLLRLRSRANKVESLEVHLFSLNRKEDQLPRAMGRRSFLIGASAAAAALAYGYVRSSEPARASAAAADLPKKVSIVEFSDSGQRKTVEFLATIIKTEAEWRKQLPRIRLKSRDMQLPSAPTRMKIQTNTRKAFFAAFAATRPCSIPAPSSSLAQAGQAFGSRLRRRIFWEPTTRVSVLCERQFPAGAVTRI
jgi:hypothetical protein